MSIMVLEVNVNNLEAVVGTKKKRKLTNEVQKQCVRCDHYREEKECCYIQCNTNASQASEDIQLLKCKASKVGIGSCSTMIRFFVD